MLGTLTVEQIYQDREAFAQRVREVAGPDMANMGLEIVSFTLRDIQDEQGYLEALGRARTAEVRRDAEIGEAEATRDSNIRKAEAERDSGIAQAQANRAREAVRFEADTQIAESERDFSVQKAAYDQETNARRHRPRGTRARGRRGAGGGRVRWQAPEGIQHCVRTRRRATKYTALPAGEAVEQTHARGRPTGGVSSVGSVRR